MPRKSHQLQSLRASSPGRPKPRPIYRPHAPRSCDANFPAIPVELSLKILVVVFSRGEARGHQVKFASLMAAIASNKSKFAIVKNKRGVSKVDHCSRELPCTPVHVHVSRCGEIENMRHNHAGDSRV